MDGPAGREPEGNKMKTKHFAVLNDVTQNLATVVAVGAADEVLAAAQEAGPHGFALAVDKHGEQLAIGERVWLCDVVEVASAEVSSWI